jgi:hypothetical protein
MAKRKTNKKMSKTSKKVLKSMCTRSVASAIRDEARNFDLKVGINKSQKLAARACSIK